MSTLNRLAFLAGIFVGALGLQRGAEATWSIVLIDLRTREIAIGSATCLTNDDIIDDAILLTGVGGAAAQAYWDPTGQIPVFIRDRLAFEIAPHDILTGLSVFDPGHQTRQYGIADVLGRTAVFTGSTVTSTAQWAGAEAGQFENTYIGQSGTVVYAIQGNVLAGSCVLEHAVQAVINTPGDLPAKLMASMQAARLAGGDGRCSCNPSAPTGCGCPVPSISKSSHVGFMLVARIGDTDGSFGIYRVGNGSWSVAAADLDGDGKSELVSAGQSANSVSVLTNVTPSGSPFGMFSLPTSYPGGAAPRAVGISDFNGDSLRDLVTANYISGTVSIFPRRTDGAYGARTDYPAGANPQAVAVNDFDGVNGPDVAIANSSADTVSVLLNNGSGGLLPRQVYQAGDNPMDVIAARVDGNQSWDLVLAARNQASLVILLNDGDGTFTRAPDVPTPPAPAYLAAGDFDGDHDTDFAVATVLAPLGTTVLLNNGGSFAAASLSSAAMPTGIAAGDVTGDGRPDLIVPLASQRFDVLRGSASGQFAFASSHFVRKNLFDARLVDVNADGDLDAVFASQGTNVIVADNLGGGVFPDGVGAANGDYFMTFNVAFQSGADPDPVIQLQGMYDEWRSDLVGRPDAVQSLAVMTPPHVRANGVNEADLIVTLRDFNGEGMTAPINSVSVEHAPGSAGESTVGSVQSIGAGMYQVRLTAGTEPGVDRFRVVIDDGMRPVTLMPDPELVLEPRCRADFNNDGAVNSQDFFDYLAAFFDGDPGADFNDDEAINSQDFFDFLALFFDGC